MFIIFMTLLAASLAAVSAQLYTALCLQAQTVEYAVQAVKLEQYTNGVLAYALAHLAQSNGLLHAIELEKQVLATCELFNNAYDGFIRGHITYRWLADGYVIEILLLKKSEKVCGLKAHIERRANVKEVNYSCVALETF